MFPTEAYFIHWNMNQTFQLVVLQKTSELILFFSSCIWMNNWMNKECKPVLGISLQVKLQFPCLKLYLLILSNKNETFLSNSGNNSTVSSYLCCFKCMFKLSLQNKPILVEKITSYIVCNINISSLLGVKVTFVIFIMSCMSYLGGIV